MVVSNISFLDDLFTLLNSFWYLLINDDGAHYVASWIYTYKYVFGRGMFYSLFFYLLSIDLTEWDAYGV